MPCYTSPDEAAFFEKQFNLKHYGVETTNITGEVACALCTELDRIQDRLPTDFTVPEFVVRWWAKHKQRDALKEA